ncbi:peptidase M50 [Ammonifex degensii KC4]|uniref:Peptidase M50 n=1 Tax=Ammonifex degensii (strain DSM 10501 / KC4) TaxID=429009 RepID=C9R7Y0_AMMDK|nr:site-2 protease family protein [Ammonifex degensii]ACX52409.1 peptidase M50 [Ammonifex degensii KC4]
MLSLVPGIMLGLSVHEYAHGKVADALGDPTPRASGRLTLNPLTHIDPIGLILLFLAGFGWAKPVPVNPYYFRGSMRWGMFWVSLAGPAANLVVAFFGALVWGLWGVKTDPLGLVLQGIVTINVVLALFNLLPVPPLDGSKVLISLVPTEMNWLLRYEQYGVIILLLLILTGVISLYLEIMVRPVLHLFVRLAQAISGF